MDRESALPRAGAAYLKTSLSGPPSTAAMEHGASTATRPRNWVAAELGCMVMSHNLR
jgi:hypothetical protein